MEDRHVEIWSELLARHGRPAVAHRPSARARLLAFLGRRFGPGFLLPMLLAEEGREVKGYLGMHRETPRGEVAGPEALVLARESAEHATRSPGCPGEREPWHRAESGRVPAQRRLRIQRRANRELRARGGRARRRDRDAHATVIVAGVAGLIADALSMGSSGYLAAKSEQEVYAHEIAMERDEIALMPEVERDELALIYEAKGMDPEPAHALATQVMADPKRMLDEQVQEELKIGEPDTSPLREGWMTGSATAFGAVIPVAPFLFLDGTTAIWRLVHRLDAVALPRRCGAIGVHRPRRVPLRLRHVRGRAGSRGRRLLRRRLGSGHAVRRTPRDGVCRQCCRHTTQPDPPGKIATRCDTITWVIGLPRHSPCTALGTPP